MTYSPLLLRPMRDELNLMGVQELLTPEAVDEALGQTTGTTFLIFNSVCGCAAGMARPAVREVLASTDAKPDQVVSVFAGQDLDATQQARSYLAEVPPSSPSMALFKDGELAFFLPRHRIEGRSVEEISADLGSAFASHCG